MIQMDFLNLTIKGRFISKKNSRRILRNRRTGQRFSFPSEAYGRYKEDAIAQIMEAGSPRVSAPYHIEYLFYVKGGASIDVDNAMASVNDILQDAGVIDNDKNILAGTFEKIPGANKWEVNVKIIHLK
jgi:Holliday junction resolvase RusA-like endonuclease